jgi:energy-converting hydrogenase B subunit N
MSIEVPIGTVHAALIEPFRIRFWVEDEIITDCEITYNPAHRGIERTLEGIPVKKAHTAAEKVCGLCGHFHIWSSVRATEIAMGIEPPERADYLRVLVAELERISSHLFFIAHGCEVLGHETFVYRVFGLREPVLRIQEELTGGRVHYDAPVLGGVRPRCNPDDARVKKVLGLVDKLDADLKKFLDKSYSIPKVKPSTTP